jgi:hypothetical protein
LSRSGEGDRGTGRPAGPEVSGGVPQPDVDTPGVGGTPEAAEPYDADASGSHELPEDDDPDSGYEPL